MQRVVGNHLSGRVVNLLSATDILPSDDAITYAAFRRGTGTELSLHNLESFGRPLDIAVCRARDLQALPSCTKNEAGRGGLQNAVRQLASTSSDHHRHGGAETVGPKAAAF